MTAWERELRAAAAEYQRQADDRRRLSRLDVAADVLEYVARDLLERARQLTEPGATRSLLEYAQEHGLSPTTVRRRIRAGAIPAIKDRGDLRIPASAHPSPEVSRAG